MDVQTSVEQTRIPMNTKPYAMRLKEPRAEPRPGLPATLQIKANVGGTNVGFDNVVGTVTIAGTTMPVLEWFLLSRRIDSMFEAAGLMEKVSPATTDTSGSSSFLSRNVQTILRLNKGYIKDIPAPTGPYDEEHIAWMKERFSGVITNEEYNS